MAELNAPIYGMFRNPRNGCGSMGFSLKGFLREILIGGVTGGLASATFYGAGRVIEQIKNSVKGVDIDNALAIQFDSGDKKQQASIDAAVKIAGPNSTRYFKVVGHGSPYSIQRGNEPLNAQQVAEIIRESPEFIGGKQKVVLFACNTGREPIGFARQLADILGVDVIAPNTAIYPKKTG